MEDGIRSLAKESGCFRDVAAAAPRPELIALGVLRHRGNQSDGRGIRAHRPADQVPAAQASQTHPRRRRRRGRRRTHEDASAEDTHNTKQPDFESAAADKDDDVPDDDTGDLPEEDEDPAATTRRLELERKRAEELARQAREKSIRDEADRKQKELEARRAKTKKAQKEMMEELRRRQEDEMSHREHQQRQAAAEAKIRQKAGSMTLATATDEIYAKHVEAYDALKAMDSIRERDVPWPLPSNVVFLTPKDDAAARKKKIVKAISRWHPDKFNAIFGSKLVSFYFYFSLMGN